MATDPEIHRILQDHSHALGRIEGRLDSAISLEPRVARLERYRAWLVGVVAGVGTLVGIIVSLFKD